MLLQMKPKWEILNGICSILINFHKVHMIDSPVLLGGSRMLYFHEKSRIARCGLFIGTDQENPIISIDEGLSQASVKVNRKVPRQFNIDIQSIEVNVPRFTVAARNSKPILPRYGDVGVLRTLKRKRT